MSAVAEPLTAGVGICLDPAALTTLLEPDCAAAVWQREMSVDVQSWLASLPADSLPRGRVVAPVQTVGTIIEQLFEMAGAPRGIERDWLTADIVELAELFAEVVSAKYLRVRLDVITTNACRKFHVDAITARLVCTYRGTGTQYGVCEGEGDPARIETVATGAPILMRGTRWPAREAPKVLHRSPPIEGTGETRLVLVLDPVAVPDELDVYDAQSLANIGTLN